MFAIFDSPGPLTTQPMTASLPLDPRPLPLPGGEPLADVLPDAQREPWKVVEVVRPQPGQAVTDGAKAQAERLQDLAGGPTSSRRSPPGRG